MRNAESEMGYSEDALEILHLVTRIPHSAFRVPHFQLVDSLELDAVAELAVDARVEELDVFECVGIAAI